MGGRSSSLGGGGKEGMPFPLPREHVLELLRKEEAKTEGTLAPLHRGAWVGQ